MYISLPLSLYIYLYIYIYIRASVSLRASIRVSPDFDLTTRSVHHLSGPNIYAHTQPLTRAGRNREAREFESSELENSGRGPWAAVVEHPVSGSISILCMCIYIYIYMYIHVIMMIAITTITVLFMNM